MNEEEKEELAKTLAAELVVEWTFGTDLEDHLSDEVLDDLQEKAVVMFKKLISK